VALVFPNLLVNEALALISHGEPWVETMALRVRRLATLSTGRTNECASNRAGDAPFT
jgi:hypothetical protein